MGSSRASADPCCSLAQQIPSLGCCHLLLPLGAPGAHPPPAALAALLPVHPGPGRVMAPRRGEGCKEGLPCPDQLERPG